MAEPSLPWYTRAEVARHNRVDDLWIIVGDSVYDLTAFVFEHPGGEHALLEHAGKDGTKAYRIVYNHEYAENKAMLASFKRGHVNESSGGGGLDAMDEVAMMHADLPGHGTQAGPPHALVIVLGTAACALLVRWLV